jgi:hypothetical protein
MMAHSTVVGRIRQATRLVLNEQVLCGIIGYDTEMVLVIGRYSPDSVVLEFSD